MVILVFAAIIFLAVCIGNLILINTDSSCVDKNKKSMKRRVNYMHNARGSKSTPTQCHTRRIYKRNSKYE